MAGQKVLDDEARTRKEMLIDRLRESGNAGLNFAGEAGSVQSQILQAEVQGRDGGKISQADALEAEIRAEDKESNDKMIELAERQVKALEQINRKTVKNSNTVRGIN